MLAAMTAPFPLVEVEQPKQIELAVGTLLNTFEPVTGDDPHWPLGYQFSTWGSCLPASRWAPCSGLIKPPGEGSTIVETVPFSVLATFTCSTFGMTEADYVAAAKDALRLMGGQQLEEELWAGTLAKQNGWPNRWLTDLASATPADGDGAGVYPAAASLAVLQKSLRTCSGDVAGVLHASAAVVSMWDHYGMIHEVDGKLRDLFGNFVIAGAGYSGNAQLNGVVTVAPVGADPGAGTFNLSVTSPITGDVETTGPIAWDTGAANAQVLLDALTIIEAGDVVVSGGALPAVDLVLTFGGRFAGQAVTVTINSAGTDLPYGVTATTPGGDTAVWGSEYAFATDMVEVRMGDVEILGELPEGLDRQINEVTLTAEAVMSATWARCCHSYVKVSLDPAATFPAAPV